MDIQAFNEGATAYMVAHKDGRYIERTDAHSLAGALLEGLAIRDRKIEDLESALTQAKNQISGLYAEINLLSLKPEYR